MHTSASDSVFSIICAPCVSAVIINIRRNNMSAYVREDDQKPGESRDGEGMKPRPDDVLHR